MGAALSPAALFLIATAIWGSTWLAIKFQLGVVAPEARSPIGSRSRRWCSRSGAARAAARSRSRCARMSGSRPGRGLLRAQLHRHLRRRALRGVGTRRGRVLDDRVHDADRDAHRVRDADAAARFAVGAALGVAGVALLFLPELRAAGEAGDAMLGIALCARRDGDRRDRQPGRRMRLQRDAGPDVQGTAMGHGVRRADRRRGATLTGVAWTFDASSPTSRRSLISSCSAASSHSAPTSCC